MTTTQKFQCFVDDLGTEVHNLDSDSLKVYLSNTEPDLASHTIKSDIAEISAGSGYFSGGASIENVYYESAGTGVLTGSTITWTASGSTIGPFRYAILYNDTSASDSLICMWDYGSSITLSVGQNFTVAVNTNILTIT